MDNSSFSEFNSIELQSWTVHPELKKLKKQKKLKLVTETQELTSIKTPINLQKHKFMWTQLVSPTQTKLTGNYSDHTASILPLSASYGPFFWQMSETPADTKTTIMFPETRPAQAQYRAVERGAFKSSRNHYMQRKDQRIEYIFFPCFFLFSICVWKPITTREKIKIKIKTWLCWDFFFF